MKYISKAELSQISDKQDDFFFLDVRENYEFAYGNIGCKHIPMDEVCKRKDEIPTDKKILLICRSGKRAEAVANYLETEFGFSNLYVLEGGIQTWKELIDSSLKID